jgi:hypothetical protein
MPVEAATYISQLSPADPPGGDPKSQGDNHLRLIKQVLQNTFPNASGAINLTPAQANEVINGLYPEWRSQPYSVIFVDANTIRVTDVNATSVFYVGRRVRVNDNGTIRYGTISVVAFVTDTNIDVVLDTGSFIGPITEVLVGGGHPNKSLEATLIKNVASIIVDNAFQVAQSFLAAINEADRVDVASATSPNLDTAASNYIRFTGTTTIATPVLSNGNRRHVLFAGILQLTNGANFILPSGANITTAAGDTCIMIGEASGVVRVVEFTRASGKAVVESPPAAAAGASMVLIETKEANGSSANLDFTTGIDGTYDKYLFVISGIRASVANDFVMRMSTDGGANYDATGVYAWGGAAETVTTLGAAAGSSTSGSILLNGGANLSTTHAFNGEVELYNPSAAGLRKSVLMKASFIDSAPTIRGFYGFGSYNNTAAAVNAVRFLMLSGVLNAGRISLYGIRK